MHRSDDCLGHEVSSYGHDESGEKVYRFNSLGFRGEEFDPAAEKKVFTVGCSYTFGVGLDEDEVWSYQFRRLLATHWNMKPNAINLMNFSEGGASNDYIARTAISQAAAVHPDVLLVLFTHQHRTEIVTDEGALLSVGPWAAEEGQELADYYYLYYTPQIGFINTVKNALLLQYFCRVNRIAYIFDWLGGAQLDDAVYLDNPICSAVAELLDRDHLCAAASLLVDDRLDVAVDGRHAGAKSQRRFGRRMFECFRRVYPS